MKKFKNCKRKFHNPLNRSLYIELFLAVVISIFAAILTYLGSSTLESAILDSNWFSHIVVEPHMDELVEEFQTYITDQEISTADTDLLDEWCKKNGRVGMFVEDTDGSILYDNNFYGILDDIEYYVNYSDVDISLRTVEITFADGTYDIYIVSFFVADYYHMIDRGFLLLSFLVFLALFVFFVHRKVKYIHKIEVDIKILESGELEHVIMEQGNDEITGLARSLNHMRITLGQQMENERKAIQANNSLVTALSHDLRTPLTTQMGYLEILKEHHYESQDELEEYIEKCLDNGRQIKVLSDRLFEYFLAFDRNNQSLQQREKVDALELFMQFITEHTMYLEEQGFHFVLHEPEEQFFIAVNPEDCMRIFHNLFSNIEKYADMQTPVVISIEHNEESCRLIIKNQISKTPRKNESAKVGLESLRALMTRQEGKFTTEVKDTTFCAILEFPVIS